MSSDALETVEREKRADLEDIVNDILEEDIKISKWMHTSYFSTKLRVKLRLKQLQVLRIIESSL